MKGLPESNLLLFSKVKIVTIIHDLNVIFVSFDLIKLHYHIALLSTV